MIEGIACPSCGQEDRSRMKPRREGRVLHVRCLECGCEWEHHTDTCPECGEQALVPVRMPLLQKARGTQQSIIGYWTAQRCQACGWASAGPPETNASE